VDTDAKINPPYKWPVIAYYPAGSETPILRIAKGDMWEWLGWYEKHLGVAAPPTPPAEPEPYRGKARKAKRAVKK